MIDEQLIKQATEEILNELDSADSRFEIEPALAAPLFLAFFIT
jgi:hypothetical protein